MDNNDHWKLRLITMTQGNHTLMGAVVLAIIGHVPNKKPYFTGLATIDKMGVVWAKFHPRGYLLPRKTPICRVEDWTDELRRLCDLCKLDDREVNEFFTEAKKWIERDERAVSRLN